MVSNLYAEIHVLTGLLEPHNEQYRVNTYFTVLSHRGRCEAKSNQHDVLSRSTMSSKQTLLTSFFHSRRSDRSQCEGSNHCNNLDVEASSNCSNPPVCLHVERFSSSEMEELVIGDAPPNHLSSSASPLVK